MDFFRRLFQHQSSTSKSEPSYTATEYECNICLETASLPVVSLCGHLYWYCHFFFTHHSWKCIHTWMRSTQVNSSKCPTCQAIIVNALVPIYTKSRDSQYAVPRPKPPTIPSSFFSVLWQDIQREFRVVNQFFVNNNYPADYFMVLTREKVLLMVVNYFFLLILSRYLLGFL